MDQFYYIYILYSFKDEKCYIGYTNNIKRRLLEHLDGKSKSTKNRRPFKLIFYEAYINKSDALRREKYFKTNIGKKCFKLMLRKTFSKIN